MSCSEESVGVRKLFCGVYFRQNFIAVAESSFVHYKENGLHITLDEFDSWVDQVQRDPNTPIPACHK